MRRSKNKKTTSSKGFDPKEGQGLARWAWRDKTGAGAPSSSDCFNFKLGTWNVRSLRKGGKMANVMQEMRRMKVNIMGVAETCCRRVDHSHHIYRRIGIVGWMQAWSQMKEGTATGFFIQEEIRTGEGLV